MKPSGIDMDLKGSFDKEEMESKSLPPTRKTAGKADKGVQPFGTEHL